MAENVDDWVQQRSPAQTLAELQFDFPSVKETEIDALVAAWHEGQSQRDQWRFSRRLIEGLLQLIQRAKDGSTLQLATQQLHLFLAFQWAPVLCRLPLTDVCEQLELYTVDALYTPAPLEETDRPPSPPPASFSVISDEQDDDDFVFEPLEAVLPTSTNAIIQTQDPVGPSEAWRRLDDFLSSILDTAFITNSIGKAFTMMSNRSLLLPAIQSITAWAQTRNKQHIIQLLFLFLRDIVVNDASTSVWILTAPMTYLTEQAKNDSTHFFRRLSLALIGAVRSFPATTSTTTTDLKQWLPDAENMAAICYTLQVTFDHDSKSEAIAELETAFGVTSWLLSIDHSSRANTIQSLIDTGVIRSLLRLALWSGESQSFSKPAGYLILLACCYQSDVLVPFVARVPDAVTTLTKDQSWQSTLWCLLLSAQALDGVVGSMRKTIFDNACTWTQQITTSILALQPDNAAQPSLALLDQFGDFLRILSLWRRFSSTFSNKVFTGKSAYRTHLVQFQQQLKTLRSVFVIENVVQEHSNSEEEKEKTQAERVRQFALLVHDRLNLYQIHLKNILVEGAAAKYD